MSKANQRTCLGCKNKTDKTELIRIVKCGNEIHLDFSKNASGRGAYVCNNLECIEKCFKTKALNRSFKCNVPEQTILEIKGEFLAKQQN